MFMTEKATIDHLKRLNKTVVCYFSGGTYEPGRPDSDKFATADKGSRLAQWPQEKWLKISSSGVRRIIADRIQLAAQKGCDAIDPDNVDGYGERGGGVSLKRQDSINFVRFMSSAATKLNLAIGLKNALEMINDVKSVVHFAVNEECVRANECPKYRDFASKDRKPVFHIEYPSFDLERAVTEFSRRRYCADSQQSSFGHMFHTSIKTKKLDGWVQYCNGQVWKTPTISRGSSRFSGLWINNALNSTTGASDLDVVTPAEVANRKAEIAASAAIQAEIAKADGYPFAPGMGSDAWLSDEELGAYEIEPVPEDQLENLRPRPTAAPPDEMQEPEFYSRHR